MSDYKRLTKTKNINEYCFTVECGEHCEDCYVGNLYERLAELEDKIENGTLIELFCKEEKQKLLKEMYEQGKFDAIADLEKEGKVVISKNEYESFTKLSIYDKPVKHRIYEFINDMKERTRKETAREILKPLYEDCKDDSYGQVVLDFSNIESLARKYGVELEEEK